MAVSQFSVPQFTASMQIPVASRAQGAAVPTIRLRQTNRQILVRAAAAGNQDVPGSSGNPYSRVYERKATWEGTFGVNQDNIPEPSATTPGRITIRPPWEAIGQLNEANLVWNDELSARLLKSVVQNELGFDSSEIDRRLVELQILLPDMVAKLPSMKASVVAALISDTNKVARRLLQLKQIFPGANVSRLATRFPALVMADDNLSDLRARAQKLREELPNTDIDVLVSSYPVEVLNVSSFMDAINEARRLVPSLDITYTLANNPTQIFSFQKGDALIPYDDPRGEIN